MARTSAPDRLLPVDYFVQRNCRASPVPLVIVLGTMPEMGNELATMGSASPVVLSHDPAYTRLLRDRQHHRSM